METTRFNDLLKGLKGLNNLNYQRAEKFFNVLSEGILINDFSLDESLKLYEAIPFKDEKWRDFCENKYRLYEKLSEKALSEKQCDAIFNFLDNVLKDEIEKGCLSSFFFAKAYDEKKRQHDYIHKKYSSRFLPYLKGTALCDVTVENIGIYSIRYLTLPQLELYCKLADEADQKGLGHLIKAVNSLFRGETGNTFVGIEKDKEGRNKLVSLIDKLCEYQPKPIPKEGAEKWRKIGFDYEKRFPYEIILFLKRLKNNPGCFERKDKYQKFQEKVVEVFLKNGGSISLTAQYLYDLDWYFKKMTAYLNKLDSEIKIKDYQSFSLRRIDTGKLSAETTEAFLTAFSDRFTGNPRDILRLGVYAINSLPTKQGKQVFDKMFDLYGGTEGTNWREFADMLLVQGEYDEICVSAKKVLIADLPDAWDKIVESAVAKPELSGQDFEYLERISSKMNPSQRDKIRKKLKEVSLIEDFAAWNKLYDTLKTYNLPVAALTEKIRERLEFIEFADNFN